jgi:hypothetical protein
VGDASIRENLEGENAMSRKNKFALSLMLSLVLCALVALPAHRAMADGETDELEMRVQSTLDAADCTAQTVSVLGLTIGIGQARIDTSGGVCADLVPLVGQLVEVKLASDIPNATTGNLKAGRVTPKGNSGSGPRIQAPIQAMNVSGKTLTLLGLSVGFSGVTLGGLDDHGNPADNNVDPSQLIVGQFVQVNLRDSSSPLVAKEVEIENFTNEVEVELEDEHGVLIDDHGKDDIDIEVRNHTKAKVPAPASPLDGAMVTKKVTRKFHASSDGKFTLRGLFTGEAKIIIERHHGADDSRGARLVRINGDRTKHITVRLRPIK